LQAIVIVFVFWFNTGFFTMPLSKDLSIEE